MRRSAAFALLSCCAVIPFFLAFGCNNNRNVRDDFEDPELSKIWIRDRMEDSSLAIQAAIFHTGGHAARISLRTGDKMEPAIGYDKASERDELMERRSLYAIEGNNYEYRFSMFLPGDFPIVPVRLVLAQWKQFCPFCSCSAYSPIVAIRYISGKMSITLQTDSVRQTLYDSNADIRNHWLEFRIQIKFSKKPNGFVKAMLNGKTLVDYNGITSYQENCRLFTLKNRYYFKMGLYRDQMDQPMTLYIDDFSKKEWPE